MKDMIEFKGFMQIIENQTRITAESNTLIGVILSNKISNISTSNVIPLSLSYTIALFVYETLIIKKHHHKKKSPEVTDIKTLLLLTAT